jgi:hypothetical protein
MRGRVDSEPEAGDFMPRKKRKFLSFMFRRLWRWTRPASPRTACPSSRDDGPVVAGREADHNHHLATLRATYRDGSAAKRVEAVRALVELGDPSVADLLVHVYPRDAEASLGAAVVVALSQLGDRRAGTFLAKVLGRISPATEDAGGRSRNVDITPITDAVGGVLAELGEEAVELLVGCIVDSGDWHKRHVAAKVLADRWGEAAVKRLLVAIDDPSTSCAGCETALRTLLDIGEPPSERAVEILVLAKGYGCGDTPLLERADPGWRTSHSARQAVPGLLRVLTASPSDRGRAAETLGLIGDARAFSPLLRLTGDHKHSETAIAALELIFVSEGSEVPVALLQEAADLEACLQVQLEDYESDDRSSAGLIKSDIKVDTTRLRALAKEERLRRDSSLTRP